MYVELRGKYNKSCMLINLIMFQAGLTRTLPYTEKIRPKKLNTIEILL